MPTFSAIALDRLLEAGSRNPATFKPPPAPVKPGQRPLPAEQITERKSTPHLPLTSPALYATPEATPLPDSPCSFPPSPYIINHKRRGPRLQKSLTKPLPPSETEQNKEANSDSNSIVNGKIIKEEENILELDGNHEKKVLEAENAADNALEEVVVARNETKMNFREAESDREAEDFFDVLDSMSSTSVQEDDGSCGIDQLRKPGTPLGEFYDAFDEISSDDGSRSSYGKMEADIREMRLNLLMEIERKKQEEDAAENTLEEANQSSPDPADDQQIIVARTVAAAVARGCARAEFELQMEAKKFEIVRLWDRLHYNEAVTREMSQRNQEAIEAARQLRYRRKQRRKWFWGSVGLAVALGSAAIAWSYLPASKAPASVDGATEDGRGN